MRIQKECKVCKNTFSAIKVTQKFCCRRCFKRDYYLRIKQKEKEEEKNPSYPDKRCQFCNNMTKLTFDPIKFPKMLSLFRCPDCHVDNTLVWANSSSPNSRQIISSLILTRKTELSCSFFHGS